MRALLTLPFLFSFVLAHAQPNSDLYLFSIKGGGDTIRFEFEKNLTQREGYDNQPSFSPDGRYVYYSAKYKLTHDIYRYDLTSGRISNISKSPYWNEFSPMVMEDGQTLSTVFIEEDSVTQRLWKINIGNSKPRLLNKKIDSVGYYWPLGNSEYASFILGTTENNHSLRIINLLTSAEELICDSIAGCIRTVPFAGNNLISFISETNPGNKKLVLYERSSKKLFPVMDFPNEATDYVWLKDYLLIPLKNSIGVYKLRHEGDQLTMSTMIVERDLSESPVINARRPALSPDHTRLILVGDDEKTTNE